MRTLAALILVLLAAACTGEPRVNGEPLLYDPKDMTGATSVVIGTPGALTSIDLMRSLDQFAAPGRPVVYYRLPGLDGRSAKDRLTVDGAAAHITSFILRHDLDTIYLVGFSTGAAINLEVAKRIRTERPDTQIHLAAISSALPSPQPLLAGWRGFRGNLAAAARTGSLNRRTIWLEYYKTLLYGPRPTRSARIEAEADRIADLNAPRIVLPDIDLTRTHMLSLSGWTNPNADRLAGTHMAFFHGENDPVFPLRALRRFVEKLPGKPVTVVYSDHGHLLMITRPGMWSDIFQFFGLKLAR